MALIKCKECGNEISNQAKACPKCGAKPPSGPSMGFIIIVGALLLFGLVSIFSNPSSTAPPSPVDPVASAKGACMLFIKKSLHDPDSADFEHSENAYASNVGDIWTIQRSVRAKNAFNATRKSVFECKMRDSGGSLLPISVREIP